MGEELMEMTEVIARKIARAREEGIRIGMDNIKVSKLIADQQAKIDRQAQEITELRAALLQEQRR